MDSCVDVDDNSSYTLFISIVNSLKQYFKNSNSPHCVISFNNRTSRLLSDSWSSWIHFSMIETVELQTEESLLCSASSL